MKSLSEMIALNRKQAEFYNNIQKAEELASGAGYSKNQDANLITRAYAKLRYQQQRAIETTEVPQRVRQLHQRWINEKAGGSFLEIGCSSGSVYTFDLIKASGDFTGVELSSAACASLSERLTANECSHKAEVVCGDILEYSPGRKFDFVYAHGVLSHFENPGLVLAKVQDLMVDDGYLVFVEPIAINPAYKLLRAVYRPFQSDAEWEWPFSQNTVKELSERFNLVDGLGWGRFSAPLTLICGIPAIGRLALPMYQWLARRELATTRENAYWMSSMVVSKYVPKR